MTPTLGQIVHSFFEDYLKVQKGLQPASVRSYGDTLRLYLGYVASQLGHPITKLRVEDMTSDWVLAFLKHIEQARGNHVRTRNQRLAALRTFYVYLASRTPEALGAAQRVDGIPVKRAAPPETHFLDREEVTSLFKGLPKTGRHALRDQALLLFLYNTGARAQEVADVRVENLDLGAQPRVHLHGKGDKWRACPLWAETARYLTLLTQQLGDPPKPGSPVFCSRPGIPLTRFGVYKIVRKHGAALDSTNGRPRRVTPHLLRHTTAVHLLESGVDVNVIRNWLGHVSLGTTNRYAELSLKAKEAAMRTCEPDPDALGGARRRSAWRDDQSLLSWLKSL